MSLDPTLDDPLFHCFWDALSERAQVVVAREAAGIAADLRARGPWGPLNCDDASHEWARVFRAAGVPAQVVSGNYWPDFDEINEPPTSTDHVWLLVDGFIFDPTAGQFGDNIIEVRHYHEGGSSA